MTKFQCIPVAKETVDRFRRTGLDDQGNQIRRVVATSSGSFPCRHCLQLAKSGEAMLLGSYNLPQPIGIYWTPSPIFLHEKECLCGEIVNDVAPIVRANSLVSVRAYDADHLCLYDLGHVCPGDVVDGPLARALSDPRTEFVNLHTARPGCLLSLVRRIPS